MYICTHRHYCTYVYATWTQLPSGCKQKLLQLCKNYNSVFDYPGEMGERAKLIPNQLKTQMGFHPQGRESAASGCSQLVCRN